MEIQTILKQKRNELQLTQENVAEKFMFHDKQFPTGKMDVTSLISVA